MSHAQTLNLLQRACIRAGIEIQYTQGFNPRPKLSLLLPRPVGIASDDEIFCLLMRNNTIPWDNESVSRKVYNRITEQLPHGLEVISINIAETNTFVRPCSATFMVTVKKEYIDEALKATIKYLLASESLVIERRITKKKSRKGGREPKIKNIDVRDFLESIELNPDSIIVKCKITPTGSIRVDEIIKLLNLDANKLELPIRRVSVQWKYN